MDAKDPGPEAHPEAIADAAPEAVARRRIDAQLRQAGWQVQDRPSVQLVGVIEAKKLGSTLSGSEMQTLAYASEPLAGLTPEIHSLAAATFLEQASDALAILADLEPAGPEPAAAV